MNENPFIYHVFFGANITALSDKINYFWERENVEGQYIGGVAFEPDGRAYQVISFCSKSP